MDIPEKPEKPPEDAPLADKWRWMEEYDEWVAVRAIKEQRAWSDTSSESDTEE